MGLHGDEAGRSLSGILPLAALLLASGTAASADCPVGDIEKALGAPIGTFKETETPVTDIQSTDGGVWRIYRRADGALDNPDQDRWWRVWDGRDAALYRR
jgi:hypothetical protein